MLQLASWSVWCRLVLLEPRLLCLRRHRHGLFLDLLAVSKKSDFVDQVKLLCLLLPIFSIAAWIVAVVASSYLSRCDDTLVHTFISVLSEERLETRLVVMGVDWIPPISFSLLTTSLIWWFIDWARILTGHWERWDFFYNLDS